MNELSEMRRAAREIFDHALAESDAGRAVRRALRLDGASLKTPDAEFDIGRPTSRVYAVAAGKAALPMATALEETLGGRLVRGVVSAPHVTCANLSACWEVYTGGHPLPDESSVEAARASFDVLDEADSEDALVVFLISGGGSAMIESPRDAGVSLEDLRQANRALVSCGATITEVNAVRRALSAIKGGRLGVRAPRATQVTLIVSDVNAGQESDVASGPTFPAPADAGLAIHVVERYGLAAKFAPSVVHALNQHSTRPDEDAGTHGARRHYVILDNDRAVGSAVEAAYARGFATAVASDLVEQHVVEGSAALVARLVEFRRRAREGGAAVCLVSGGEFACPVRGRGVGGRNAETALRCALEFEGAVAGGGAPLTFAALFAGTDGIDGNSPAAGALVDSTTLARARARGLDARRHLDDSDAHTFFHALGDAVVTGPTGTNVRDLRILLAT